MLRSFDIDLGLGLLVDLDLVLILMLLDLGLDLRLDLDEGGVVISLFRMYWRKRPPWGWRLDRSYMPKEVVTRSKDVDFVKVLADGVGLGMLLLDFGVLVLLWELVRLSCTR